MFTTPLRLALLLRLLLLLLLSILLRLRLLLLLLLLLLLRLRLLRLLFLILPAHLLVQRELSLDCWRQLRRKFNLLSVANRCAGHRLFAFHSQLHLPPAWEMPSRTAIQFLSVRKEAVFPNDLPQGCVSLHLPLEPISASLWRFHESLLARARVLFTCRNRNAPHILGITADCS